jgi:general secretion pathway protein D
MRNALKILMAGALMTCAAFAQEQSGSVEGILKELSRQQPAKAPVAGVVDPGQPRPTDAATINPAAVATEAPAATPVDVPAALEKSRDFYAGGEFEKAQAGFESVIKQEPENQIARMYLRKLLERDARKVEVSGMKEVTGDWCTGLTLRSYAVSAEAAGKMELKDVKTATDVSAKFPEVDFPKGASAVYQPKLEKLFIRNTRENLAVAEEILAAMDVAKLSSDVEQVEIEAKFVEVSEGTLEELGFEWRSLASDTIHTGIEGNDVTIPGGQYLFDDALRGGPGNAAGMPFSQPKTLGAGSSGVSGEWTAFRFEDTFNASPDNIALAHRGSTPLDILISALDQSSGADVLSAPRVVTKSGKKATIRVGQMHYYPETYEVSASGGNIVHVKYADWGERLLGVELDVTPQVDGGQIELGLNPKILELQGWQNYEVAPADSSYTWYQYRLGMVFSHEEAITAQLPIFRKRELKTEVTIANGSTMGMGGLINEKVEKYEDKVPVLGSLPLVGRLFRNEGERAVKRNLLMFVTAKKVEPSGRISTDRSFE